MLKLLTTKEKEIELRIFQFRLVILFASQLSMCLQIKLPPTLHLHLGDKLGHPVSRPISGGGFPQVPDDITLSAIEARYEVLKLIR